MDVYSILIGVKYFLANFEWILFFMEFEKRKCIEALSMIEAIISAYVIANFERIMEYVDPFWGANYCKLKGFLDVKFNLDFWKKQQQIKAKVDLVQFCTFKCVCDAGDLGLKLGRREGVKNFLGGQG